MADLKNPEQVKTVLTTQTGWNKLRAREQHILSTWRNRLYIQERTALKDVELKLVIELLKNSHRSDRELARAIGVSQPTLSRTRVKLEKLGMIREYTIIPDYLQLGLTLMSITFTKMKGPLSQEILGDLKKRAGNTMREHPSALILGNTGMGCNADYVAIAFHKDYTEYSGFMRDIREYPCVNIDETRSFVIDLLDKNQLQPLSFHHLAGYLAKAKKNSQTQRKDARVSRTKTQHQS
jgi:DNA-binding Lrp family transcriptional regulator